MDFLLKFLILGGKYLTRITAQSIIEAYNRSMTLGSRLNTRYQQSMAMTGGYDNMLEMYNSHMEEIGSNVQMHLAFISDEHKRDFEAYLRAIETQGNLKQLGEDAKKYLDVKKGHGKTYHSLTSVVEEQFSRIEADIKNGSIAVSKRSKSAHALTNQVFSNLEADGTSKYPIIAKGRRPRLSLPNYSKLIEEQSQKTEDTAQTGRKPVAKREKEFKEEKEQNKMNSVAKHQRQANLTKVERKSMAQSLKRKTSAHSVGDKVGAQKLKNKDGRGGGEAKGKLVQPKKDAAAAEFPTLRADLCRKAIIERSSGNGEFFRAPQEDAKLPKFCQNLPTNLREAAQEASDVQEEAPAVALPRAALLHRQFMEEARRGASTISTDLQGRRQMGEVTGKIGRNVDDQAGEKVSEDSLRCLSTDGSCLLKSLETFNYFEAKMSEKFFMDKWGSVDLNDSCLSVNRQCFANFEAELRDKLLLDRLRDIDVDVGSMSKSLEVFKDFEASLNERLLMQKVERLENNSERLRKTLEGFERFEALLEGKLLQERQEVVRLEGKQVEENARMFNRYEHDIDDKVFRKKLSEIDVSTFNENSVDVFQRYDKKIQEHAEAMALEEKEASERKELIGKVDRLCEDSEAFEKFLATSEDGLHKVFKIRNDIYARYEKMKRYEELHHLITEQITADRLSTADIDNASKLIKANQDFYDEVENVKCLKEIEENLASVSKINEAEYRRLTRKLTHKMLRLLPAEFSSAERDEALIPFECKINELTRKQMHKLLRLVPVESSAKREIIPLPFEQKINELTRKQIHMMLGLVNVESSAKLELIPLPFESNIDELTMMQMYEMLRLLPAEPSSVKRDATHLPFEESKNPLPNPLEILPVESPPIRPELIPLPFEHKINELMRKQAHKMIRLPPADPSFIRRDLAPLPLEYKFKIDEEEVRKSGEMLEVNRQAFDELERTIRVVKIIGTNNETPNNSTPGSNQGAVTVKDNRKYSLQPLRVNVQFVKPEAAARDTFESRKYTTGCNRKHPTKSRILKASALMRDAHGGHQQNKGVSSFNALFEKYSRQKKISDEYGADDWKLWMEKDEVKDVPHKKTDVPVTKANTSKLLKSGDVEEAVAKGMPVVSEMCRQKKISHKYACDDWKVWMDKDEVTDVLNKKTDVLVKKPNTGKPLESKQTPEEMPVVSKMWRPHSTTILMQKIAFDANANVQNDEEMEVKPLSANKLSNMKHEALLTTSKLSLFCKQKQEIEVDPLSSNKLSDMKHEALLTTSKLSLFCKQKQEIEVEPLSSNKLSDMKHDAQLTTSKLSLFCKQNHPSKPVQNSLIHVRDGKSKSGPESKTSPENCKTEGLASEDTPKEFKDKVEEVPYHQTQSELAHHAKYKNFMELANAEKLSSDFDDLFARSERRRAKQKESDEAETNRSLRALVRNDKSDSGGRVATMSERRRANQKEVDEADTKRSLRALVRNDDSDGRGVGDAKSSSFKNDGSCRSIGPLKQLDVGGAKSSSFNNDESSRSIGPLKKVDVGDAKSSSLKNEGSRRSIVPLKQLDVGDAKSSSFKNDGSCRSIGPLKQLEPKSRRLSSKNVSSQKLGKPEAIEVDSKELHENDRSRRSIGPLKQLEPKSRSLSSKNVSSQKLGNPEAIYPDSNELHENDRNVVNDRNLINEKISNRAGVENKEFDESQVTGKAFKINRQVAKSNLLRKLEFIGVNGTAPINETGLPKQMKKMPREQQVELYVQANRKRSRSQLPVPCKKTSSSTIVVKKPAATNMQKRPNTSVERTIKNLEQNEADKAGETTQTIPTGMLHERKQDFGQQTGEESPTHKNDAPQEEETMDNEKAELEKQVMLKHQPKKYASLQDMRSSEKKILLSSSHSKYSEKIVAYLKSKAEKQMGWVKKPAENRLKPDEKFLTSSTQTGETGLEEKIEESERTGHHQDKEEPIKLSRSRINQDDETVATKLPKNDAEGVHEATLEPHARRDAKRGHQKMTHEATLKPHARRDAKREDQKITKESEYDVMMKAKSTKSYPKLLKSNKRITYSNQNVVTDVKQDGVKKGPAQKDVFDSKEIINEIVELLDSSNRNKYAEFLKTVSKNQFGESLNNDTRADDIGPLNDEEIKQDEESFKNHDQTRSINQIDDFLNTNSKGDDFELLNNKARNKVEALTVITGNGGDCESANKCKKEDDELLNNESRNHDELFILNATARNYGNKFSNKSTTRQDFELLDKNEDVKLLDAKSKYDDGLVNTKTRSQNVTFLNNKPKGQDFKNQNDLSKNGEEIDYKSINRDELLDGKSRSHDELFDNSRNRYESFDYKAIHCDELLDDKSINRDELLDNDSKNRYELFDYKSINRDEILDDKSRSHDELLDNSRNRYESFDYKSINRDEILDDKSRSHDELLDNSRNSYETFHYKSINRDEILDNKSRSHDELLDNSRNRYESFDYKSINNDEILDDKSRGHDELLDNSRSRYESFDYKSINRDEILDDKSRSHDELLDNLRNRYESFDYKAINRDEILDDKSRSHDELLDNSRNRYESFDYKSINRHEILDDKSRSHDELLDNSRNRYESVDYKSINRDELLDDKSRSHGELLDNSRNRYGSFDYKSINRDEILDDKSRSHDELLDNPRNRYESFDYKSINRDEILDDKSRSHDELLDNSRNRYKSFDYKAINRDELLDDKSIHRDELLDYKSRSYGELLDNESRNRYESFDYKAINRDEFLDDKSINRDQLLDDKSRSHDELLDTTSRLHDELLGNKSRLQDELLENNFRKHDELLDNKLRHHDELLENNTKNHDELLENKSRIHDDLLVNKSNNHDELLDNKSKNHDELLDNKSKNHDELLDNKSRINDDLLDSNSIINDELLANRSRIHDELLDNKSKSHGELLDNNSRNYDELIVNKSRMHDELLDNKSRHHDELLDKNSRNHDELLDNELRHHDELLDNNSRNHDKLLDNNSRNHDELLDNESRHHDELLENKSRIHDEIQNKTIIHDEILNKVRIHDEILNKARNHDDFLNTKPRSQNKKFSYSQTTSRDVKASDYDNQNENDELLYTNARNRRNKSLSDTRRTQEFESLFNKNQNKNVDETPSLNTKARREGDHFLSLKTRNKDLESPNKNRNANDELLDADSMEQNELLNTESKLINSKTKVKDDKFMIANIKIQDEDFFNKKSRHRGKTLLNINKRSTEALDNKKPTEDDGLLHRGKTLLNINKRSTEAFDNKKQTEDDGLLDGKSKTYGKLFNTKIKYRASKFLNTKSSQGLDNKNENEEDKSTNRGNVTSRGSKFLNIKSRKYEASDNKKQTHDASLNAKSRNRNELLNAKASGNKKQTDDDSLNASSSNRNELLNAKTRNQSNKSKELGRKGYELLNNKRNEDELLDAEPINHEEPRSLHAKLFKSNMTVDDDELLNARIMYQGDELSNLKSRNQDDQEELSNAKSRNQDDQDESSRRFEASDIKKQTEDELRNSDDLLNGKTRNQGNKSNKAGSQGSELLNSNRNEGGELLDAELRTHDEARSRNAKLFKSKTRYHDDELLDAKIMYQGEELSNTKSRNQGEFSNMSAVRRAKSRNQDDQDELSNGKSRNQDESSRRFEDSDIKKKTEDELSNSDELLNGKTRNQGNQSNKAGSQGYELLNSNRNEGGELLDAELRTHDESRSQNAKLFKSKTRYHDDELLDAKIMYQGEELSNTNSRNQDELSNTSAVRRAKSRNQDDQDELSNAKSRNQDDQDESSRRFEDSDIKKKTEDELSNSDELLNGKTRNQGNQSNEAGSQRYELLNSNRNEDDELLDAGPRKHEEPRSQFAKLFKSKTRYHDDELLDAKIMYQGEELSNTKSRNQDEFSNTSAVRQGKSRNQDEQDELSNAKSRSPDDHDEFSNAKSRSQGAQDELSNTKSRNQDDKDALSNHDDELLNAKIMHQDDELSNAKSRNQDELSYAKSCNPDYQDELSNAKPRNQDYQYELSNAKSSNQDDPDDAIFDIKTGELDDKLLHNKERLTESLNDKHELLISKRKYFEEIKFQQPLGVEENPPTDDIRGITVKPISIANSIELLETKKAQQDIVKSLRPTQQEIVRSLPPTNSALEVVDYVKDVEGEILQSCVDNELVDSTGDVNVEQLCTSKQEVEKVIGHELQNCEPTQEVCNDLEGSAAGDSQVEPHKKVDDEKTDVKSKIYAYHQQFIEGIKSKLTPLTTQNAAGRYIMRGEPTNDPRLKRIVFKLEEPNVQNGDEGLRVSYRNSNISLTDAVSQFLTSKKGTEDKEKSHEDLTVIFNADPCHENFAACTKFENLSEVWSVSEFDEDLKLMQACTAEPRFDFDEKPVDFGTQERPKLQVCSEEVSCSSEVEDAVHKGHVNATNAVPSTFSFGFNGPLKLLKSSIWNWGIASEEQKSARPVCLSGKDLRKQKKAVDAEEKPATKRCKKKYHYETKQIKSLMGKPVNVTYLVEDVD